MSPSVRSSNAQSTKSIVSNDFRLTNIDDSNSSIAGLSMHPDIAPQQALVPSIHGCSLDLISIGDESLYTHGTTKSLGSQRTPVSVERTRTSSLEIMMNTSETTLPIVNAGDYDSSGTIVFEEDTPQDLQYSDQKKPWTGPRDPAGMVADDPNGNLARQSQTKPRNAPRDAPSYTSNELIKHLDVANHAHAVKISFLTTDTRVFHEDDSVALSTLSGDTFKLTPFPRSAGSSVALSTISGDTTNLTPYPRTAGSAAVSTVSERSGFSSTPPYDSVGHIRSSSAAKESPKQLPKRSPNSSAEKASDASKRWSTDTSSLRRISSFFGKGFLRQLAPSESFYILVKFHSQRKSLLYEIFHPDHVALPAVLQPYVKVGSWRKFLQATVRSATRDHLVGTMYVILGSLATTAGFAYCVYGLVPSSHNFISRQSAIGVAVVLIIAGICMLVWGKANQAGGVAFMHHLDSLCRAMSEQTQGIMVQLHRVSEGSTESNSVFAVEIFRTEELTESMVVDESCRTGEEMC